MDGLSVEAMPSANPTIERLHMGELSVETLKRRWIRGYVEDGEAYLTTYRRF